MDYLKQFFKSAVSRYVEDVPDNLISFGYDTGMEIRDLRLRTPFINDMLRASDSEARLEFGRIGHMRLVYTPIPGIVTIQIKDLDIRVRPNFTGLALRKMVETLQELGDFETGEETGPPLPPLGRPPFGGLSPCLSPSAAAFQSRPEVHNTSARLVHPCRLPPVPRVVRRAQFVRGPSEAPSLFLKPVRSSMCEDLPRQIQSCLHSLTQMPGQCLRGAHVALSEASSECLTASRQGCLQQPLEQGGSSEVCAMGGFGGLLSNCVEAVSRLAPDASFDELDRTPLPTLKFSTSPCLPAVSLASSTALESLYSSRKLVGKEGRGYEVRCFICTQSQWRGAACELCPSSKACCPEQQISQRSSPITVANIAEHDQPRALFRIRQVPTPPPGENTLVLRPRLVLSENEAPTASFPRSVCPLDAQGRGSLHLQPPNPLVPPGSQTASSLSEPRMYHTAQGSPPPSAFAGAQDSSRFASARFLRPPTSQTLCFSRGPQPEEGTRLQNAQAPTGGAEASHAFASSSSASTFSASLASSTIIGNPLSEAHSSPFGNLPTNAAAPQ